MKALVVVPARMGSSRFPGKPLAMIAGKTLLERVWRLAEAVPGADAAVVATDDEGLLEAARGFGAEAVLTPKDCRNGSERALAAVRALKASPELVLNLQGDAPLTPPWVGGAVLEALSADPKVEVATPAVRLDAEGHARLLKAKEGGKASGTTVVAGLDGSALYFSKAVIPFVREKGPGAPPVWKHIGLYGYRLAALERYASWTPTPLEQAEQLEQLRFLEHGTKVRVVPVDFKGRRAWSVDNPEDVAVVERIIAEDGELVP